MTKPDSNSQDDTSRDGETEGPHADADSLTTNQQPPSNMNWNQAVVFRFVGLGTELAGFTLVCAGIGYLIDSYSQNQKPYGTALGALIGFSLGMVRFIQQARRSDDS